MPTIPFPTGKVNPNRPITRLEFREMQESLLPGFVQGDAAQFDDFNEKTQANYEKIRQDNVQGFKAKLSKASSTKTVNVNLVPFKDDESWTETELVDARASMLMYPSDFSVEDQRKLVKLEQGLRDKKSLAKGPVGFYEDIRRSGGSFDIGKHFGIESLEGIEALTVFGPMIKKINLWRKSKSKDPEDIIKVLNEIDWEREKKLRGVSTRAQFGGGVVNLLPWMLLMTATGGLAGATKGTVTGLSRKFVPQALRKTFGGKLALKAARWTAGGIARTIATSPLHLTSEFAGRRTPKDYQLTEKGLELILPSESPNTDFFKSIGATMIEYMSEEAGKSLGIGKKGQNYLMTHKNPILRKLSQGLFKFGKRWSKTSTAQILSRAGYTGLIGEIGEERLGDLMRATFHTGVYREGADFVERVETEWPTWKEALIEAGVLLVPGGVGGLAGLVGGDRGSLGAGLRGKTEAETVEELEAIVREGRLGVSKEIETVQREREWDDFPLRKDIGEAPTAKDVAPQRTDSGDFIVYHATNSADEIIKTNTLKADDIGAVGIGTTVDSVQPLLGYKPGKGQIIEVVIDKDWLSKQDIRHEGGGHDSAFLIGGIGKKTNIPSEAIKSIEIVSFISTTVKEVENLVQGYSDKLDNDIGVQKNKAQKGETPGKDFDVPEVETETVSDVETVSDIELHRLLSEPTDSNHRTQAQFEKIMALSRERGYDEAARHDELKRIVGKESTKELSKSDANTIIEDWTQPAIESPARSQKLEEKLGLNDKEKVKLFKKSKSRIAYNRAMESVLEQGLSDEPQIRNAQMKRYYEQAKSIGKRIQRLEHKASNLLNPILSAVQYIGNADERTGQPLFRTFFTNLFNANMADITSKEIHDELIEKIGLSTRELFRTNLREDLIQDYLFDTKSDLGKRAYQQMNEKERKVADAMHEMLTTEIANIARSVRFKYWLIMEKRLSRKKQTPDVKRARERLIPPDLKATSKPLRVLEEGKKAMAEDRYDTWINEQTWGTRESYYMSEGNMEALETLPTVSLLQFEDRAAESLLLILPSEARTREQDMGPSRKPLFPAILSHIQRLTIADHTLLSTSDFWDSWRKTEHTREDTQRLQKVFNNIAKIEGEINWIIKKWQTISKNWWRFHFTHFAKSSHFAARNVFQNAAVGPFQMNPVEVLRAGNVLIDKKLRAPTMGEDYDLRYKSRVSQRTKVVHEFYLQHEDELRSKYETVPWISSVKQLMDNVASLAIRSDDFNRTGLWAVAYQSAYSNVVEFRNKLQSMDQLERRMALEQMHPAQQRHLLTLLADNKDREFVNQYAEMKTLSVNYGYQTSLRSLTEQSAAGRLSMGVVVWTRGFLETMWNGGVQPFMTGIQNNEVGMTLRGAKHLMYGILSMYLVRDFMKLIFGKRPVEAYDPLGTVLGYGPGAPGVRWITETFDLVSKMQRGISDGRDAQEIVVAVLRPLSYKAEHFLPLADVMINMAREKDPETLHLWTYFRNEINHRRGSREWRTPLQKMQSWIFNSNKYDDDLDRESGFQEFYDLFSGDEEEASNLVEFYELLSSR